MIGCSELLEGRCICCAGVICMALKHPSFLCVLLLLLLQMGLGKTAQSISVMAWLRQYGGVASPFMVVAPLTTLHHWKREIETWTGMVR